MLLEWCVLRMPDNELILGGDFSSRSFTECEKCQTEVLTNCLQKPGNKSVNNFLRTDKLFACNRFLIK